MTLSRAVRLCIAFSGSVFALAAASPALAEEERADKAATMAENAETLSVQDERQGPPAGIPGGSPQGDIVFDETWVTVGIGAGLVPSYSGSDDYRFFPLPLIVGRVGGVGITPNGPGFTLNLLSEPPAAGPPSSDPSFSVGPAFRFRNDRADAIKDDVVRAAGELDTALEVGANAGVTFPGVLHSMDRVGVGVQARWDILGAHDGMLIEPSVRYFTPLGRDAAMQLAFNASFVDGNYADYYYSVSPEQSTASGLAEFTADGGLDSLGAIAILTFDLDGNVLNGGFSIYGIGGYSRIVGDGADTPYTSVRGSADQFIGGLGLAYTF